MIIRDEQPSDMAAIRQMLTEVMGAQEAQLVDDLRSDGDVALSLVAERDGAIVGHILFSPLQAPFRALALAPLAVALDWQGRGVGSAVVREGLHRARQDGWSAVFVLGEPAYYGRFGFDSAAAAAFECVYAGPYFMLLSLGERLSANSGLIGYPRAFGRLQ